MAGPRPFACPGFGPGLRRDERICGRGLANARRRQGQQIVDSELGLDVEVARFVGVGDGREAGQRDARDVVGGGVGAVDLDAQDCRRI